MSLWSTKNSGGLKVMEWKGYTGNIINVDLSNNRIYLSKLNIADVNQFIGGIGINTKLAADLITPNINPLSPENYIIIGVGPLVGTITPGSSRVVATSKFPATGAIAYSCGSMSFGFNLKQAGYDHIIISGKADEPCCLNILNNHIEICNAKKLWGRSIIETHDALKKKFKSCGTLVIGQAGENIVFNSLALIDRTATIGRGGLGAVMGSKNLKAIVTIGSEGIDISDPKRFNILYNRLFDRIKNYPHRESWHKLGMLRSLPVGMLFKVSGQNQKARQCGERIYLKNLKRRRIACPSCPMGDKDILELKEGNSIGLIHYATSIINPFLMFVDLDGLNYNHEAILAHDKCNQYGLDYMMIVCLFNYCNKLSEKGILTKNNSGIEWNTDINTLLQVIEKTAHRTGFGDVLAEGIQNFMKKYNIEGEKLSHVKGLDIVFEPRLVHLGTMEFEQIVNPKGSHVASGGSPTYMGAVLPINKFKSHFNRMGIPSYAFKRIFTPPVPEMMISVGRLTRYAEDWYTVLTSLGLCARAQINRFYGLASVTEFYNAITGFNFTTEDLRIAAERTWNLLKLMNVKEGFSRKDDSIPEDWFKPLKFGNNTFKMLDFFGETIITPDIANKLLDDYYEERGWDKFTGIPTQEKIKELGLEKFL
ncbi:MAG: aldehyde ferredoxin oxidoreductase N-terminal domain-containing protein [Promethearchaeota archaeon]